MSKGEVTVIGMRDLKNILTTVMPREAANITRRAVVRVAALVRDDMRKATKADDPKMSKAIIHKRERGKPGLFEAGVYITAGKAGGTPPRRRWHWREFGSTKNTAKPFVTPAVKRMEAKIPSLFREEVGRQLERELAKKAK